MISNNRERLLLKFEKAAIKNWCCGKGWRKRLLRLILFQEKYLIYAAVRILNVPLNTAVAMFWGERVCVSLGDSDAMPIYGRGVLSAQENPLTRYLIKCLDPDAVFYDIGANYGFYTGLASQILEKGEVHVFEPNQRVFLCLQRSFGNKRPKIFLNPIALSDKNGPVIFYVGLPDKNSGANSIVRESANHCFPRYTQSTVESITLDNYVANHTPPTFIKLDVEGAENSIIQGGRKVIQSYHPTIAMEVRGDRIGYLYSKAIASLSDLGYTSFLIKESGEPERVANINLQKILDGLGEEFTNVIFKYLQ